MTASDRHRRIRAALIDAGVGIDRADRVAAELAADDTADAPRRWLSDALVQRRQASTPPRLRFFDTPDPDDAPPAA